MPFKYAILEDAISQEPHVSCREIWDKSTSFIFFKFENFACLIREISKNFKNEHGKFFPNSTHKHVITIGIFSTGPCNGFRNIAKVCDDF